MALKDKVTEILKYIKDHKDYINHNYVLNDIYNGNLLPYVLKDLQASVSPSYFRDVKDRMIPLNILPKLMEKLSKAYNTAPTRTPESENETDQELIEFYEKEAGLNSKMNDAETFSFLFKGYAIEPFIDDGCVGIRPLPFDRFLVISENTANPLEPTMFIKFLGKKNINGQEREIFYAYTDEEFWAFDDEGATYFPALDGNDGINPFGVIPFFYGNRGSSLLPIQDTDLLAMTKTIPKMLSDLSGSILYNAFPIVYTIDVDSVNLERNPNAVWAFKSDADNGKTPSVNTITPKTEIHETLDFIAKVLSTWLEFRGIKAGNIGNIDNSNVSGISKVMDIVDTLELRKQSIVVMQNDEESMWEMLAVVHNYWVDNGELLGVPKFSSEFELSITFDEPKPIQSRKEQIEETMLEVDNGLLSKRAAIERLNPDKSTEQIDQMLLEIDGGSQKFTVTPPMDNSAAGVDEANAQGTNVITK
jgi:ribosomal protein L30/L7E